MASCEAERIPFPSKGCQYGIVQVEVNEAPSLPSGYPETLESPMAWAGADFTQEGQYVHFLNETEIQEIEDALSFFKGLEEDGDQICREKFPLPTLAGRLDKVREDLYNGKGFGVIRGLKLDKYTIEDRTMIYLGIQAYMANLQGRQDGRGNMIVHIVADDSSKLAADHHRHSTSPITFHNEESGDIVSWLTVNTAASGGRCIIASAYTAYNAVAAARPDLVRTLAGSDWPFALPKFHCRPVLFMHEGRMIMNFGRTPLVGSDAHPRPAHIPILSDRQLEALDAIEHVARATQLEIVTRPGDIHLINNLAILHRREGFVNGQSLHERRHLMRMRLRDDELGWAIPESLKHEWFKAFDDPNADRVWHLEPMPEGYFPLRKQPN